MTESVFRSLTQAAPAPAELQASVRDYRELAHTDALTGLPNRRAIEESLERECARAARQGTSLSVAMLDLDEFKQLNDRCGHAAGDEALRRYASTLRRLTHNAGFLGRLGGDEFLLILPAWAPVAWRSAERLRAAVAQQALNPGWSHCTVSVGIASVERPRGTEGPALIQRADAALYDAKRHGKDRVFIAPASAE